MLPLGKMGLLRAPRVEAKPVSHPGVKAPQKVMRMTIQGWLST